MTNLVRNHGVIVRRSATWRLHSVGHLILIEKDHTARKRPCLRVIVKGRVATLAIRAGSSGEEHRDVDHAWSLNRRVGCRERWIESALADAATPPNANPTIHLRSGVVSNDEIELAD